MPVPIAHWSVSSAIKDIDSIRVIVFSKSQHSWMPTNCTFTPVHWSFRPMNFSFLKLPKGFFPGYCDQAKYFTSRNTRRPVFASCFFFGFLFLQDSSSMCIQALSSPSTRLYHPAGSLTQIIPGKGHPAPLSYAARPSSRKYDSTCRYNCQVSSGIKLSCILASAKIALESP